MMSGNSAAEFAFGAGNKITRLVGPDANGRYTAHGVNINNEQRWVEFQIINPNTDQEDVRFDPMTSLWKTDFASTILIKQDRDRLLRTFATQPTASVATPSPTIGQQSAAPAQHSIPTSSPLLPPRTVLEQCNFTETHTPTEFSVASQRPPSFAAGYNPFMVSIGSMHSPATTSTSVSAATASHGARFYLLLQCNALTLPRKQAMHGAVFQCASQANGNESQGRYATDPQHYIQDLTQGPLLQLSDPVSAVARFLKIESCDFLAEWKNKPAFAELFDYQYGYLTPRLNKEIEAANFIAANINSLRVNVERVGAIGQIQVLNFGLALGQYDTYAYARTPDGVAALNRASAALLKAQYEMVAHVAVAHARANPTLRIPVVFTLVGGGVFANPAQGIAAAILAAETVIRRSGITNIDVCLSAFRESELVRYRGLLGDQSGFNAGGVPTLQETHLNAPLPTPAASASAQPSATPVMMMTPPVAAAAPTPASTAPIPATSNAITFKRREPLVSPYIIVGPDNTVHLFIPVSHGESIGLDNTCQSHASTEDFFKISTHKESALHALKKYEEALLLDIALLRAAGKDVKLEESRLAQIREYASAILPFMATRTHYVIHNAIPNLLNQRTNLLGMVLAPRNQDNILHTGAAAGVCVFNRNSGRDLTRTTFLRGFANTRSLSGNAIKAIISRMPPDFLNNSRKIDRAAFQEIMDQLKVAFASIGIREIPDITPDFFDAIEDSEFFFCNAQEANEISQAYYDTPPAVMERERAKYAEFTTPTQRFIYVLLTHPSYLQDTITQSQSRLSPFYGIQPIGSASLSEQEKLADQFSLATQFLIGQINIYCYANQISRQNFGEILDRPESDALRHAILNAILTAKDNQKTPEEAVIDLINSAENRGKFAMARELTLSDKGAILNAFSDQWNLLVQAASLPGASLHFDEFLVFTNRGGHFATRSGFMGTLLTKYIQSTTNSEFQKLLSTPCIQKCISQEQVILSQLQQTHQPTAIPNGFTWDSRELSDRVLAMLEKPSNSDGLISEFLLLSDSKTGNRLFQFIQGVGPITCHSRWEGVFAELQRKAASDPRLREQVRTHFSSSLFYVTKSMLESLYIEAIKRYPVANVKKPLLDSPTLAEDLNQIMTLLNGDSTPAIAHVSGIIQDQGCYLTSARPALPKSDKRSPQGLIEEMHRQHRNKLHLTQAMARRIYSLAKFNCSQYGRDEEYNRMNALSNTGAMAPSKLIEALRLCGLDFSSELANTSADNRRISFPGSGHSFDGYIITVTESEKSAIQLFTTGLCAVPLNNLVPEIAQTLITLSDVISLFEVAGITYSENLITRVGGGWTAQLTLEDEQRLILYREIMTGQCGRRRGESYSVPLHTPTVVPVAPAVPPVAPAAPVLAAPVPVAPQQPVLTKLQELIFAYTKRFAEIAYDPSPREYSEINRAYLEKYLGRGHSNIRTIEMLQDLDSLRKVSREEFESMMSWLRQYKTYPMNTHFNPLYEEALRVYMALTASPSVPAGAVYAQLAAAPLPAVAAPPVKRNLTDLESKLFAYAKEVAIHLGKPEPINWESINRRYLEELLGSGHSNIETLLLLQNPTKLKQLSPTDFKNRMKWLEEDRKHKPTTYTALLEAATAAYQAQTSTSVAAAAAAGPAQAPSIITAFFQPVGAAVVEPSFKDSIINTLRALQAECGRVNQGSTLTRRLGELIPRMIALNSQRDLATAIEAIRPIRCSFETNNDFAFDSTLQALANQVLKSPQQPISTTEIIRILEGFINASPGITMQ
jgi:hypothetical protein